MICYVCKQEVGKGVLVGYVICEKCYGERRNYPSCADFDFNCRKCPAKFKCLTEGRTTHFTKGVK